MAQAIAMQLHSITTILTVGGNVSELLVPKYNDERMD